MENFLNNFGSSIFALLMLITTLTVPIFQKNLESNIQSKKENAIRYRRAYDNLMSNLFEYIKSYNYISGFIKSKIDQDLYIEYDGITYKYMEFVKINLEKPSDIVFEIFVRSLDIHVNISDELNGCVTAMRKMIKLLKDNNSEFSEENVSKISDLYDKFLSSFVRLKTKIISLID